MNIYLKKNDIIIYFSDSEIEYAHVLIEDYSEDITEMNVNTISLEGDDAGVNYLLTEFSPYKKTKGDGDIVYRNTGKGNWLSIIYTLEKPPEIYTGSVSMFDVSIREILQKGLKYAE